MLLYANTSVFMWKSIVFWFCTVWCLHTRCEMRHVYTLRCPAPFWLIQCKPYRNRFITAKVIDKSLGARFLWPTVYNMSTGAIIGLTLYNSSLITKHWGRIILMSNQSINQSFICRCEWPCVNNRPQIQYTSISNTFVIRTIVYCGLVHGTRPKVRRLGSSFRAAPWCLIMYIRNK